MAKFSIRRIMREDEKDYNIWTRFLEHANGNTIFHHPDFLSYHGKRFDEHHLGIFKGEELFGLIPLAIEENDREKIAKSPYGASYGGFVFKKILKYKESRDVIHLFLDYLKNIGIKKVLVTPPLATYHRIGYSDTFCFSLLENGFEITNSDITSIIPLNDKNIETEVFTSRIRNVVRKARKYNIDIRYNCNINDFWLLMEKTFAKHGAVPTHSKDQYEYLMKMFPDRIYCNIAYLENVPVAGIGIFEINKKNIMSFYLCSDIKFQQSQALSMLIYETALNAKKQGFDFFDFGTSSVNMIGRENIFRYKESFGSVGRFKHTYEINL